MTRFARAKGSKSSNKREPEEATPWNIMKQGLLNQKQNNNTEKTEEPQKQKDTLNSLREESTVSWSTFDEDIVKCKVDDKKKGKKKIKNLAILVEEKNPDVKDQNGCAIENNEEKIPKKKKKSKTNELKEHETPRGIETNVAFDSNESKKRKKKETKLVQYDGEHKNEEIKVTSEENSVGRNRKRKKKAKMENGESNNNESVNKKIKNNDNSNITSEQADKEKNKGKFPVYNKAKNEKEFKNRRKPIPEPISMNINGIQIDIVQYDGFPIKKEDAERLDELKKKLYIKGIPRDEIKKIMKLQRRNAEKALSRTKKHVCFKCRKSGHNLSECPELNQGEGTGICFKCGSTEHTHFECKVTKKLDFKFANCFICKEQGHISNQCPDNPRGLYPKGGACKLCGDVTHLKRFCPSLPKQTDVTIDAFLDEGQNNSKPIASKGSFKTNKKHVRF